MSMIVAPTWLRQQSRLIASFDIVSIELCRKVFIRVQLNSEVENLSDSKWKTMFEKRSCEGRESLSLTPDRKLSLAAAAAAVVVARVCVRVCVWVRVSECRWVCACVHVCVWREREQGRYHDFVQCFFLEKIKRSTPPTTAIQKKIIVSFWERERKKMFPGAEKLNCGRSNCFFLPRLRFWFQL